MDKVELAALLEANMPAQYRWCNRIYEIGKLLHPEETVAASPDPGVSADRDQKTA